MKKSACLIILLLAMVLSLLFSAVNCWANEKLYKMTGSVAAIDREHNTVVVEVPMVGKTFTVGGPLAPNAVLKRGGNPVDLAAFLAGDQVVVTWRPTERGHLILSLIAK